MMKEFILNLDVTQQRPVVALKNLTALLDTGAYIPVWTDDEDILISGLGAKLLKKNIPFTGFGGITYGNLYQVTLEVGELIFPNMHIVANNELNTSYNLILSATMFEGLIYEINTYTHVLKVTTINDSDFVRNLRIIDRNGKLHVLCNSDKEGVKDIAAGLREKYVSTKESSLGS